VSFWRMKILEVSPFEERQMIRIAQVINSSELAQRPVQDYIPHIQTLCRTLRKVRLSFSDASRSYRRTLRSSETYRQQMESLRDSLKVWPNHNAEVLK